MTEPTMSTTTGERIGPPYEQLQALGLVLPPPRPPSATYVPVVLEAGLVYLSGQGPISASGKVFLGKVGTDLSSEEGYEAARQAGLNLLSALEQFAGSLTRVSRIVKVFGMVNAGPDFKHHPQVVNGCSDMLVAVFGEEIGRHARSAVGMGSLPSNIAVEIEMIAALRD